ncbi:MULTISPECIES: serine/threonine-protein kinase [unclassified Streptomyces]|uniref:serine/threonine-protein kinase n=1 Tax=unclassified Streptomyces TaxID=2593676 RepID=UPI0016608DD2|nr:MULTISPECIES: serine/threonine-protein kinase [unclassified Streptomyces]MBD0709962.1 serine/threonine protein kinase [Streptomyces sp. CBMA291]MBD0712891.1 serine/threonine protein kinase [Streptomyces sp. CBMA370]MBD0717117.1 serine/threonine protein kinase [Streptomyces sp. CBMA370]
MNGRVVGGRYELATLIGQGGMGQVWTAYDGRLDRRVAVKLLRPAALTGPATAADELRRRFVRECRVTARVDHPGLVTVFDAGSEGDDLYLVMRYVEGADLADHLAENDPYPWEWAVCVAAQLCGVLAAVHAVPIVHRDLKPRNVMVRPDGSLVVLDLGIASVLDADTTRLTHTGSPIGSPAYMAPEQAMGGTVGPSTDLYALGVLLHELLSGTVPFAGSTALGVLHRHLHEPPAPLRSLRPEVPEALETLVLRLLAKDPGDRPAGAHEVYQRLLPLLPARGGPVGPMDPTRPVRSPFAPWPDRPAPASAPAPAPASAPALPSPVPPPPPPPPPRPPVDPRTDPHVDGYADGHAVPRTGPSLVPRTDPRAYASPSAGSDVASGVDVAAAVDEVKRLLGEGSVTQAVDVLGGILPVAAAEHGERSPVVHILRKQYASTLMDDGQYRRALPELRRLVAEREAVAGPADPQAVRFRYDAALCLEQSGETAEALAEFRAVLPHIERERDLARAFDVRQRIGLLLVAAGAYAAGRDGLQRLLFDVERAYGPYHPLAVELRGVLERQRRLETRS